jgi:transposase
MNSYSNDLRRKIVEAYERGDHTLEEVAELFGVSLASVKNFLRRKRETGSSDALPHAGGKRPALNEKARIALRNAIKENNDLTLEELRRFLKGTQRKEVSLSTLSRLLQALGLPRKKSRSTLAREILPESSRPEAAISKR